MKIITQGYFLPIAATSMVIVLFIILLYKELLAWLQTTLLALKLNGPKALPIVGNALLIRDSKELVKIACECYEEYGPIFRAWISVIPTVFIYQPDHLQAVLGSSKQIDKNFLYSYMHNFIGEGLITNNGNKWFTHRKYIQSYFNINYLDGCVKTFSKHSKMLIRKLDNSDTIKITNFVNDSVLNILHEIVFGLQADDEKLKNQSPFRKGKLLVQERLTKPWMLLEFLYRLTSYGDMEITQKSKLQNFTKKVLENKKGNRAANNEQSLLDIFIKISETHFDFTEDDIINEACTFMLAGQDSVASAVSFTLYFLAKYTEYQDKAREEVDEILDCCENNPKVSDLNNMKYLGCCIKEALRLCPSVPIIARRLSEKLVLDDITLPNGCNVFIAPFVTHRLKHLYPNPEEYNPERFLSENGKAKHPYSFIPFSAGPRNCLGYKFAMLEIKTIVSHLLKSYYIYLDQRSAKLDLLYRITLRAKGGIWVKLDKR